MEEVVFKLGTSWRGMRILSAVLGLFGATFGAFWGYIPARCNLVYPGSTGENHKVAGVSSPLEPVNAGVDSCRREH